MVRAPLPPPPPPPPDRLKEIEAELHQVTRELDRLITLVVDERAPRRMTEETARREKKVRERERLRLSKSVPDRFV